MIETEVQKYAQVFSGCEIRLSSFVLKSLRAAVAKVGEPHDGTIAKANGYVGVRVAIDGGHATNPMRWVTFIVTDGHRMHRAEYLVPLPEVAAGIWYTTKEAIAAAYDLASAAETLGDSWKYSRLVLESRPAGWPDFNQHFIEKTAPRRGDVLSAGSVGFNADYIRDAVEACHAFGSQIIVQPSERKEDPIRFDAVLESGRCTCVLMPRGEPLPLRTRFSSTQGEPES